MSGSGLAYRADIDGLRAIAVLPVILFHAGMAGFEGGFVGVDVFFVVSGYLITSIIAAELEAGKFTLLGFYDRRVRRILPALFLVLGASVPPALVILVPEHLEDFGQSVIAAALFVSNFFFCFEDGYFEGPADLHPLLHTWSLAVEEQFYLLFPLLLMLLARWRVSPPGVLAVLAIASFAFGVWQVMADPTGAFYLLPARFWELMLGALLAVAPLRALRSKVVAGGLVLVGLGLIGFSVASYGEHVRFPGAAALLPCLGAALVIHGGRSPNGVSIVLGSAPFKRIGLLSYSLYLWHFPLFVFARHLIVRPFTGLEVLVLVALTFVLALLTWRFVEQPFRARPRRVERRALFRLAGLAMLLSVAFGLFTDFSDGARSRMGGQARDFLDAGQDKDTACLRRGERCGIGEPDRPPAFILWGDSHAGAMLPAFQTAADALELSGRAALRGGCPPVVGYRLEHVTARACAAAIERGLEAALAPEIRLVIIATRWTMVFEESVYGYESGRPLVLLDAETGERSGNRALLTRGLDRTLAKLREAGKAVVLIGPVPEIGWHVPHTLAQRARFGSWLGDAPIEPAFVDFLERNDRAITMLEQAAARHGARLLLPHEWLCAPGGYCRVLRDDRPLYFDTDHLTKTGAAELVPMARSALETLVSSGS